jgi:IS30 family transposase
MMMLAETCIIGGTMDGYSHLGIAEREDIMVRWKGHEGVSQIARELHRDKSTISREIRRNGWQSASTAGAGSWSWSTSMTRTKTSSSCSTA